MSKRNEDPTELVKVQAPTWLTEHAEQDTSLETVKEHRVMPRIKVIQGTTRDALKEAHGEGAMIMSPGSARLAAKDETLKFVPLFFFTEWCKWSDLDDEETPSVLERTFDPTNEIAKRSKDPNKRHERYGPVGENGEPKYQARYVEHLNFVGVVYGDHELSGSPVTLSFSRGEYGRGRVFINDLFARKVGGKQVPLYCQVWELRVGRREQGPKKKWFGIDPVVPEDGQTLIEEEHAEGFKTLHEEFKELVNQQRLMVDHDDAEDPEEETVEEAERTF